MRYVIVRYVIIVVAVIAVASWPNALAQPSTYEFPSILKSGTQHIPAASYKSFRQQIHFAAGEDTIRVSRAERSDAGSADWYSMYGTYSVAGFLLDVTVTNGGDILFVAYMDDVGSLFIEKWTFTVRNGRWIHVPPTSPAPQYSGVTQIKGGGSFVVPTDTNHVTPRRKIIFRGAPNNIAELRAVEADPEGRFLLLYDNDRTMWQLPVSDDTSGPVTMLYDLSNAPDLAATRSIEVSDHSSLGRVYVCMDMTPDFHGNPDEHILLIDTNNDGAIDSKLGVSTTDWLGNPIYGVGMWTLIADAGIDP